MNEQQVITLAKQENDSAFRQLYVTYREDVYQIAYRYTRSQEEAEDVLQETFIKAFKNIKKFKNNNEFSFAAWLTRICINCSINQLRKLKSCKMDEMTSLSDIIKEPESKNPTPEISTQINQDHLIIQKAIQKLTHKQRIIFDMRFSQGKQIKEIAQILGCSESNVKTQIFDHSINSENNFNPSGMNYELRRI